jgi:hypothetical protein
MTSLSCTQAAAWSASVTCTMAAGDGDADPVRFAITWGDGASETTAAYATPATVVRPHTMASEGVKTISVKASDTPVPSWSSGTATATVSVDLLPPALSVSAPAPGKIYRGCTNAPGVTGPATEIQRGCLSFSASDAVSGLDHVAISAPNACAGSVPASVSGTGPWTFDYPLCSTAATMVSVTAFDVAGHSTTQARSVRDVV